VPAAIMKSGLLGTTCTALAAQSHLTPHQLAQQEHSCETLGSQPCRNNGATSRPRTEGGALRDAQVSPLSNHVGRHACAVGLEAQSQQGAARSLSQRSGDGADADECLDQRRQLWSSVRTHCSSRRVVRAIIKQLALEEHARSAHRRAGVCRRLAACCAAAAPTPRPAARCPAGSPARSNTLSFAHSGGESARRTRIVVAVRRSAQPDALVSQQLRSASPNAAIGTVHTTAGVAPQDGA
jgi:hypothetical protein